MSTQTQATLQGKDSAEAEVLYMAIEMGEKSWKLLFSSGEVKANGQLRVYRRSVGGNDYEGLREAVEKATERFKLSEGGAVISCYEAGQDGFWPHRRLDELGIVNRVVDSASIEVNRRHRRAKTDKLDVRKLLEMLVRSERGEQGVWRVGDVPSVEEEDRRRLHRELERIKKEEKQHRTRIRSLLKLHGVRPGVNPGGRGWKEYLAELEQVLPQRAWSEIVRESERLELVRSQKRALEAEQQEALEQGADEDALAQQILALSLLRGIGIVALARRLLVALWRYVDHGVLPEGAEELKPAA